MTKISNNRLLYIAIPVILFWFLFTIIVLIQNQKVKHKLTGKQIKAGELKQKVCQASYRDSLIYKENLLEGEFFNAKNFVFLNDTTISVEKMNTQFAYSVLILFTKMGCQPCLENELKLWQDFYNSNPKVYIAGLAKTYFPYNLYKNVRTLAQFPFLLIKQSESIFTEFGIDQPTILFINNINQQIIYAHCAEIDNTIKSKLFIDKITRFIQYKIKN